MTTFNRFWEAQVAELADDYVDPSGKTAGCGAIALKVATKLAANGVKPSILYLQSPETTEATVFASRLIPTPYGGRRIWMFHVVCAADDVIYDPMLRNPVDFSNYPAPAFGEKSLEVVKSRVWTPEIE